MLIIGYQRQLYHFNQASTVNVRLGSHVGMSVKPSQLEVLKFTTTVYLPKLMYHTPKHIEGKLTQEHANCEYKLNVAYVYDMKL